MKNCFMSQKKNDLDILMCPITTIDINTNKFIKLHYDDYFSLERFNKNFDGKSFSHKNIFHDFNFKISVTPPNKLYKKKFLEKNNIVFPENLLFEDEVFWMECYLKANRINIYDKFLYFYRVNRNDSSVKNTSKFIDIVKIFDLLLIKFIETGTFEEYKPYFF